MPQDADEELPSEDEKDHCTKMHKAPFVDTIFHAAAHSTQFYSHQEEEAEDEGWLLRLLLLGPACLSGLPWAPPHSLVMECLDNFPSFVV